MTEKKPIPLPPDLLEALIQNPHESQIVVDQNGIIKHLGTYNAKFFEISESEAIGHHILEVNPESDLPIVLQTGRAEIGRVSTYKGMNRIVAAIPLRGKNGKIIGAVGKIMFAHTNKVKKLIRQFERIEKRLSHYAKELKKLRDTHYSLDKIIGESLAIQMVRRLAVKAANSNLNVLILGKTGTGKEILANAIHQLSDRKDQPFVKINCASIPRELFESELFGYEGGAFTGASKKGKAGKFDLANKGSILLDEVGDMPLDMQAKLLRVLQEMEVERIGGTITRKVDVRTIAATNRDLREMISDGSFREDFYYRLCTFPIQMPTLRSIPEDIPKIAYSILNKLQEKDPTFPHKFSPNAMKYLMEYHWPGNVRELNNIIARSAVMSSGSEIKGEDLPDEILKNRASKEPLISMRKAVSLAERKAILVALQTAEGNVANAASLLGIHRTGLYKKMKAYDIEYTTKADSAD